MPGILYDDVLPRFAELLAGVVGAEHVRDHSVESFLERTRRLVERLSQRSRYDVVFIDARAGLNEATAGAVLGLGADVLLFGVDRRRD